MTKKECRRIFDINQRFITREVYMPKTVELFLDNIEMVKLVKMERFDEVDQLKVVEQDGVDCLIDMRDYPEQEEHESSFNYERG